mmetsp:Transcript_6197/g.13701  ORF Transcript_6197/g.13701 Transcript_6197/m.13701 type:complete len:204 (-) Transcript_6197:306-917(-)
MWPQFLGTPASASQAPRQCAPHARAEDASSRDSASQPCGLTVLACHCWGSSCPAGMPQRQSSPASPASAAASRSPAEPGTPVQRGCSLPHATPPLRASPAGGIGAPHPLPPPIAAAPAPPSRAPRRPQPAPPAPSVECPRPPKQDRAPPAPPAGPAPLAPPQRSQSASLAAPLPAAASAAQLTSALAARSRGRPLGWGRHQAV